MVAPRAPKPWKAILLIPFGGLVILYLGFCLGWNLNRVIQGTGIFIDILGVVIIAIPDIPAFHGYLFSGKLKAALDELRIEDDTAGASMLAEPDADKRLLDALTVVEDAQNCTVDDYLEKIGVKRDSPPPSIGFYELREAFRDDEDKDKDSWHNVYGFKVFEGPRDNIRTIIMREIDGTPKKRIEGVFHHVFQPIEDRIEEEEMKIRLLGLAFLLIGFLYQFLSLFFSQSSG